ncbi:MAG TPA: hypothetical protein VD927_05070 [Chryseosolibacter sp.]|nr:hypothetical protein [Chryseosolibacter sp.]
MTREQFKTLWTSRYPKTIPIAHLFKHDYSDRWFRIHSLHESKRYADNEEEWRILLNRQNSIITDILGDNSKVLIVTGEYHYEGHTDLDSLEDVNSIKQFSFTYLDNIDLHKLSPEDYDQGQTYKPRFSESVWLKGNWDNVLRDIAQDNVRVFFISVDNDIVVAPYDGGIDFILKDTVTRDSYKNKYRDWLSDRDDGL